METPQTVDSTSSDMDLFFSDMDFESLRIDPINYEIPVKNLLSGAEFKFEVPSWANTPGSTNGAALHEVCDGKTVNTHDLDLSHKKYYMFGRNPQCPCDFGASMTIKNSNVSRQHFVIMHSKYEALYLMDLGSVHGTYVGKKRAQRYVPIQLHNGNVLSVGGWDSKYLVRIFPKKFNTVMPFARFSAASIATAEKEKEETGFDPQTKLHTHLNQVPDLPSPHGKHLIKPLSFYSISSNIPLKSPLTRSPKSGDHASGTMFRAVSTYHLGSAPAVATGGQMQKQASFSIGNNPFAPTGEMTRMKETIEQIEEEEEEEEEEPVEQVTSMNIDEKISIKQSRQPTVISFQGMPEPPKLQPYGSRLRRTSPTGGILKKYGSTKRLGSFRRVSFYDGNSGMKSKLSGAIDGLPAVDPDPFSLREKRFQKTPLKSQLNIESSSLTRPRTGSTSSIESDTIEAVEFDPSTDLPEVITTTAIKRALPRAATLTFQPDEAVGNNEVRNLFSSMLEPISVNMGGDTTPATVSTLEESEKADIFRTYSVQNVRKRFEEEVQYSFLGARSGNAKDFEAPHMGIKQELNIRARENSYENMSPIGRQVKRAKSFHIRK